jgi:hypothetical protein
VAKLAGSLDPRRFAPAKEHVSRLVVGQTITHLPGGLEVGDPLFEDFPQVDSGMARAEEDFDGGTLAMAEDKRAAGHGVLLELLAACSGETIHAVAEIHRLRGDQDPQSGAGWNRRTALWSQSEARTGCR